MDTPELLILLTDHFIVKLRGTEFNIRFELAQDLASLLDCEGPIFPALDLRDLFIILRSIEKYAEVSDYVVTDVSYPKVIIF